MKKKKMQFQKKQPSGKFNQIEKRKKMLTGEIKKMIGGIIIQGKQRDFIAGSHKSLISGNHNEIFVNS